MMTLRNIEKKVGYDETKYQKLAKNASRVNEVT